MFEMLKIMLQDVRERRRAMGDGATAGRATSPRGEPPSSWYHQDGLSSMHDHEFMVDPAFMRAYARGVQTVGLDFRFHWRVHVGLWAAACASKLSGDFVECGVGHGVLSSAIMTYLDWDRLDKTFYLLDTFAGLDTRYVSEGEIREGALEKNAAYLRSGQYTTDVDHVRRNFSEWRNVAIIQGAVPDTLPRVDAARVAFLHLDMNCAPPEVAAAEFFWPRLVAGAFVLLDDYAYQGYPVQKLAMDGFARSKGVTVVSLPTGQGMLIKPPS